MALPCSISTALPRLHGGTNVRVLPTFLARRGPHDVQLHANQSLSDVSASLSISLPRWLAGEGHPRAYALRPCVRTSTGRFFPPRRCGRYALSRMDRLPKLGIAVLERGYLGAHAAARHHAA